MKTQLERFLKFVHKTPTCWLWIGGIQSKGYGMMRCGRAAEGMILAHRFAYEHFKGPLSEGLEIDHLCRVRCCVNPDHLELVTRKENLHRSPITIFNTNRDKIYCIRGHAFTTENTRMSIDGRRICRSCHRIRNTKYAFSNNFSRLLNLYKDSL